MPHRKQEDNQGFATLDDPAGKLGIAKASPAFGCRPPDCLLGDRVGKWHDYVNAECPRCGFATIDINVAQARRPGFDFKKLGLIET